MPLETIILAGAIGFVALITFITLIIAVKTKKRYKTLVENTSGESLDEVIIKNKEDIRALEEEVQDLKAQNEYLQHQLKTTLQKVGFKRYNAFDNMGSNLSFSLALLDGEDNGVVITSLSGRDGCSVYGKDVNAGRSEFSLSEEEIEVMKSAK